INRLPLRIDVGRNFAVTSHPDLNGDFLVHPDFFELEQGVTSDGVKFFFERECGLIWRAFFSTASLRRPDGPSAVHGRFPPCSGSAGRIVARTQGRGGLIKSAHERGSAVKAGARILEMNVAWERALTGGSVGAFLWFTRLGSFRLWRNAVRSMKPPSH